MNKRLFFVFLTSLSKVPRREILQVGKNFVFDPSTSFFVEYTATVESCASI